MSRLGIRWLRRQVSLGVMISLGLAGAPLAATVYVDAANTSGIEDGTQASPYDTIQEGFDAASRDQEPADVVLVAPGIYIGPLVWKSGVLLKSAQGAEVTIVDGGGASQVLVPPPRPVDLTSGIPRGFVDGFTIRNGGIGTLLPIFSRYAPFQTGEMNVDNCVLEDAATAVSGSLFSHLNMSRTVIRSVDLAIVGSLAFDRIDNVTIDDVGAGIVLSASNLIIYNTTVSNTTGNGIQASCSFFGCGGIQGDCLNLWNAPLALQADSSGRRPYLFVPVQLAVDPLFVDAPIDHRLQAQSPLIDAGIDIGLPFLGAAPDIGAYEYGLSIPERIAELVQVIQDVPPEAFPTAAEQRANALENKLDAVLEQLASITDSTPIAEQRAILSEAIDKLQHDILAKTDGFFGGNPQNDWIVTLEGQQAIHPLAVQLIDAVQTELDALPL